MSINLIDLKHKMVECKVYDAWQYIESLIRYINYMKLSQDLVKEIDVRRKKILSKRHDEAIQIAKENKTSVNGDYSRNTDIQIGDSIFSDSLLQEKNVLDFFHYARLSIDILFQVLNAALLIDNPIDVDDTSFIVNVYKKLKLFKDSSYKNLVNKIKDNKESPKYKFIQAVDNYVKHIKSIQVSFSYNILDPNDTNFKTDEFSYRQQLYEKTDIIEKINDIYEYVRNFVEEILNELIIVLSNCKITCSRIQDVILETQEIAGKKRATFFIEVDNDLSELPDTIRVFPVSTGEYDMVYCSVLNVKTIFIKSKKENKIIGCAKLNENFTAYELYRPYEILEINSSDYEKYINSDESEAAILNFNFGAAKKWINRLSE